MTIFIDFLTLALLHATMIQNVVNLWAWEIFLKTSFGNFLSIEEYLPYPFAFVPEGMSLVFIPHSGGG